MRRGRTPYRTEVAMQDSTPDRGGHSGLHAGPRHGLEWACPGGVGPRWACPGVHGAGPAEVLLLPYCSRRHAGMPEALSRPQDMPDRSGHGAELRRARSRIEALSIPIAVSDVAEIITRKEALILDPNSNLVRATESKPVGPVAAIRVSLLRVSKFNEGMPELVEESFAFLVLPISGDRVWTTDEVDIVEVVTDPMAVALSHAAIITEESLLMRERLMEQNMALDQAHREALLAKGTWKSLQSVRTREIVGPIHLVVALLSALQLRVWVQTVRMVGAPGPSRAASCAAWTMAWVEPS